MHKIFFINASFAFEKIYKAEYKIKLNQHISKPIEPLSMWGLSEIHLEMTDGNSYFFKRNLSNCYWHLPVNENTHQIYFDNFTEIADRLIEICKNNILVIDDYLVNDKFFNENSSAKEFHEYTLNNNVENRLFFEHAVLNFEFTRAKKNFQATIITENFLDNNPENNPFDDENIKKHILEKREINLDKLDSRIEGTKTFFRELYENNLLGTLIIHWKIQESLNYTNLKKLDKLKIAEEILNVDRYPLSTVRDLNRKKVVIYWDKFEFSNNIGKIAREPFEFFHNLCDRNYINSLSQPTGFDHIGRGGWKNLYVYLYRLLVNPEQISDLLLDIWGEHCENFTNITLEEFRFTCNTISNDLDKVISMHTADYFFYWDDSIYDQTFTNKKFVKKQNRPIAYISNPKASLTSSNINNLKTSIEDYCNNLKKSSVPVAIISVPLYLSQEETIDNITQQIKSAEFYSNISTLNISHNFLSLLIELIEEDMKFNPFFTGSDIDIQNIIDPKLKDKLFHEARLVKIILKRLNSNNNFSLSNINISNSDINNEYPDTLNFSIPQLLLKWKSKRELKKLFQNFDQINIEDFDKFVDPITFIFENCKNNQSDLFNKPNLLIPLNNKLEEDTVKKALRVLIARAKLHVEDTTGNTSYKICKMLNLYDDLTTEIDDYNALKNKQPVDPRKVKEIEKKERVIDARISELLLKGFSYLIQAISGKYFTSDKNLFFNLNNNQKKLLYSHIYKNINLLLNNHEFISHPIFFELFQNKI